MKVLALSYMRNEADIAIYTVPAMIEQGIDCYIIDNWSTDATYDLIMHYTYRYHKHCTLERWPEAPDRFFCLAGLLGRVERAAKQRHDYDWYVLFGADEFLEGPYNARLIDALENADAVGATCVDFASVDFQPTDNEWWAGIDPREHFQHWSRGRRAVNIRAWKGTEFHLVDSHDVQMPERRVLSVPFIIRHYPWRSQEQATRKVFEERKPRYDPAELKIGWHRHMDQYEPGHRFIQDPATLHKYDPETFYDEVLACRGAS